MNDIPRIRYPTKAELARAVAALVAAAKESGLQVAGVEVAPDGSIRTLEKSVASPQSAFDRWQEGRRHK